MDAVAPDTRVPSRHRARVKVMDPSWDPFQDPSRSGGGGVVVEPPAL
eukprot:CAMPEP_0181232452 /NCGR_PEP_ID=MMETSP1096-20121128/35740_1 /TAXON_ID=156174 ORGANISM="Chrysochromulina ericina, Strain CCMP281" /NCGR_SAMPLE_ID=MMETSP1096 /ASSEMBLY_ACC=CAM_ASM_000453 /LENGTH=46 /DNA_ID= /DNA_START= /DNA_END= /DNA_ORIENTATION=